MEFEIVSYSETESELIKAESLPLILSQMVDTLEGSVPDGFIVCYCNKVPTFGLYLGRQYLEADIGILNGWVKDWEARND